MYDRRREYNKPEDNGMWSIYYDLEFFKSELPNITEACIVIEEATGFVSYFKELELTDIIIGAQHNRNSIIFVFHSVSDIPVYIERLSDWLIITKTNDDLEKLKFSRPRIAAIMSEKKGTKEDIYIDLNEI